MSKLNRHVFRVRRKLIRYSRRFYVPISEAADCRMFHRAIRNRGEAELFAQWALYAPWGKTEDGRHALRDRLADEDKQQILAAADRAYERVFDLLGSGPTPLGPRIDWHCDFKSGHRWDPKQHYTQIRWDKAPEGADIKVPWELSRCQHFIPLGLADWLTGDSRYYTEFKTQARSWIEANPFERGVNWACPMDVSIRAVNWLAGAALFADRIQDDPDESLWRGLAESLWLHGAHIARNLEWNGPGTGANHLLADLTGLFTLGVFFRETAVGRRWLDFARRALEREIQRQVTADGVHFERSTSYHRLALEMFEWNATIGMRSGLPFSPAYIEQLTRMRGFLAACRKPDGRIPSIGDADDGRLIWDGVTATDDVDSLAVTATKAPFRPLSMLLRGMVDPHIDELPPAAAFGDGGFYIFRRPDVFLLIRAGALAHAGAHAHNDQGSFVLNLQGRDVFVDRGTYVYTSDRSARNLYRSSRAHNVLVVNKAEQNRIPARLFALPDETQTRVLEQGDGILEIVHRGFRELGRLDAEYRRRFELHQAGLTILDSLSRCDGGDQLLWSFHLAPGLMAKMSQEGVDILDAAARRLCTVIPPLEVKGDTLPFSHSPSYGVKQEASVLLFRHQPTREFVPGPADFLFHVRWHT